MSQVVWINDAQLEKVRADLYKALFEQAPPVPIHKANECWKANLWGDGKVSLTRYVNGQKIEGYRISKGAGDALLDLAAISLGFQPPRRPDRLDKPAD